MSDDPRYGAALEACESAQAALDAAHLLSGDPESLTACAKAYRQRAEAWDRLTEALPREMPLTLVTALFLASTSDADSAQNYSRWTDERRTTDAGDAR